MKAAARPTDGNLVYYRCSWLHLAEDEPITLWYEVDHEGRVLRLIEIFANGKVMKDDITRYPDRASEFGFGTLIGDDFYRLEWDWPSADDPDPTVMLDASAFEFDAVWGAGE
jgi:hypothetical protein